MVSTCPLLVLPLDPKTQCVCAVCNGSPWTKEALAQFVPPVNVFRTSTCSCDSKVKHGNLCTPLQGSIDMSTVFFMPS